MKTSLRELFKSYTHKLQQIYPEQEAKSITFWLLEFYLEATRKDILADKEVLLGPGHAIEEALAKVLTGVPIQQVTGLAPFYGREFKVNSHVLIPRNETEELVHLIINENRREAPFILDIGTGSGCIPITLALEIPHAKVSSIDISPEALAVASDNAALLNAKVDFQYLDILKQDIPYQELDIIVSNPPYVRELEKAAMHANVLDHEPHLALFVKDDDPLIFYREITIKASRSLKEGGRLYFEINEDFAEEMEELLLQYGYKEVKCLQDLNGKMRIAVGVYHKTP